MNNVLVRVRPLARLVSAPTIPAGWLREPETLERNAWTKLKFSQQAKLSPFCHPEVLRRTYAIESATKSLRAAIISMFNTFLLRRFHWRTSNCCPSYFTPDGSQPSEP